MKIIYHASDITEAEIVKGMLLANGLQAEVSGYYLQGGVGEVPPSDLAKVLVNESDYDSARVLIHEYEGKQTDDSESNDETKPPNASITQSLFVTIAIFFIVAVFSYWILI